MSVSIYTIRPNTLDLPFFSSTFLLTAVLLLLLPLLLLLVLGGLVVLVVDKKAFSDSYDTYHIILASYNSIV